MRSTHFEEADYSRESPARVKLAKVAAASAETKRSKVERKSSSEPAMK